MKCPYQTKLIRKAQRYGVAYDITEFCDCIKEQCPFYYVSKLYLKDLDTKMEKVEVCRRAESEVRSLYVKEKNDQIQNTF